MSNTAPKIIPREAQPRDPPPGCSPGPPTYLCAAAPSRPPVPAAAARPGKWDGTAARLRPRAGPAASPAPPGAAPAPPAEPRTAGDTHCGAREFRLGHRRRRGTNQPRTCSGEEGANQVFGSPGFGAAQDFPEAFLGDSREGCSVVMPLLRWGGAGRAPAPQEHCQECHPVPSHLHPAPHHHRPALSHLHRPDTHPLSLERGHCSQAGCDGASPGTAPGPCSIQEHCGCCTTMDNDGCFNLGRHSWLCRL